MPSLNTVLQEMKLAGKSAQDAGTSGDAAAAEVAKNMAMTWTT